MKKNIILSIALVGLSFIHSPVNAMKSSNSGYNWFKIGAGIFGLATVASTYWALQPGKKPKALLKQEQADLNAIKSAKEKLNSWKASKVMQQTIPNYYAHEVASFNNNAYEAFDQARKKLCIEITDSQDMLIKAGLHEKTANELTSHATKFSTSTQYLGKIFTDKINLQTAFETSLGQLETVYTTQKTHFDNPKHIPARSRLRFILPALTGLSTIAWAWKAVKLSH